MLMEQVNKPRVEHQANKGHHQKRSKLPANLGAFPFAKGPQPVEEIVADHCSRKASSIGQEFIDMQFIFQEPGNEKIDYQS